MAIAADGSAALSLPDPTSVLRQDNQKDSAGELDSGDQKIVPKIGEKLKYVFGKATGSAHNVERSTTMARQLGRIGIFDNEIGSACLRSHLKAVLNDTNSILKIQDNGRILRESMLMGPNGGVKVHSVWEGSKLITINLFGT